MEARTCLAWSQAELAKRAGIGHRTVTEWETQAEPYANAKQYSKLLAVVQVTDRKQFDRRHESDWCAVNILLRPLLSGAAGHAAILLQDFVTIWLSPTDVDTAIRQTQELLKGGGNPPLMFSRNHVHIEIESDGDATIEFRRTAINISSSDVRVWPGELWFEYGQHEDINLRGESPSGHSITCKITQDYPNRKEFYCCFTPPIPPLCRIEYTVKYNVTKMFRKDHYWSIPFRQLTVDASISIRHKSVRRLRSPRLEKITFDGEKADYTPTLNTSVLDGVVSLDWQHRFPEPFSTYKLCWDFDEAAT